MRGQDSVRHFDADWVTLLNLRAGKLGLSRPEYLLRLYQMEDKMGPPRRCDRCNGFIERQAKNKVSQILAKRVARETVTRRQRNKANGFAAAVSQTTPILERLEIENGCLLAETKSTDGRWSFSVSVSPDGETIITGDGGRGLMVVRSIGAISALQEAISVAIEQLKGQP